VNITSENAGYSCNGKQGEFSLRLNSDRLYDLKVFRKEQLKERRLEDLTCLFAKTDRRVFTCVRHDLGGWRIGGNKFYQNYFDKGKEIVEDEYFIYTTDESLPSSDPKHRIQAEFNSVDCKFN
jgi:hypothetical protein